MKPLRLVFNGKFLTAPSTGVHRVAEELILALDLLASEDAQIAARVTGEVVLPIGASRKLPLRTFPSRQTGRLRSQLWEQMDLPRTTNGRLLVNLCNVGPVAVRRAVTMFHDAQVRTSPGSYSRAFRTYYRMIQPVIARRHARILTVSDFSRQQLAHYGVVRADAVSVIHNGVDHVLRARADAGAVQDLGLEPGRYVVALANTQIHKNIGVLLAAFSRTELANLKLVLFGGGDRSAFLAAGHSVPENVVFTGRITDERLRGLLESALCLAFPSTTEGFGLPPLEAMLLGCPAIAAPCGALPEVCGDAVLYAPPDDPAAWALAISSLAADPQARQRLAEAGRAHARPFTWMAAARRLLDVLETIA